MYYIEWSDGSGLRRCVAQDKESAWDIYWAILQQSKKIPPPITDHWMRIWNRGYRDPTKGSKMSLINDNDESTIILRKGSG